MFVGVIHKAIDLDRALENLKSFDRSTLPTGLSNPVAVVGDGYAFCLWEAPSVDALREFLDPLTKGATENTYFAVDPEAPGTFGFPVKAHATA